MPGARELTKVVQSDEAMRLELLASLDILNHHAGQLAAGIQAARQAGAIFATLETAMATFAQELDRLAKSVAGITGVVPSVVATIGDLAGKFKANANDPARIGQLADELDAAKVNLATAIVTGSASAEEAPAQAPATDTTTTATDTPAAATDGEQPATDPAPQ